MKHTKEPWSIHHTQPTFIRANDGRKHVGNTDSMGERSSNEANARRIVACVNACAGLPNEVLELDQPQFVALIKQRAELLSALQGVLPFLTGDYWPGEVADAAVDRAIAIARKAEAGTAEFEGHNVGGKRT